MYKKTYTLSNTSVMTNKIPIKKNNTLARMSKVHTQINFTVISIY